MNNGYTVTIKNETDGAYRTMVATGSMTLDECVQKLLDLGYKVKEIIIKPL